ncbi:C2H2 type zinc-finger-domain-containing protein [Balamuthia mandrillaris]
MESATSAVQQQQPRERTPSVGAASSSSHGVTRNHNNKINNNVSRRGGASNNSGGGRGPRRSSRKANSNHEESDVKRRQQHRRHHHHSKKDPLDSEEDYSDENDEDDEDDEGVPPPPVSPAVAASEMALLQLQELPSFACALCEQSFTSSQVALHHMAMVHHFIISDAPHIADLSKYLDYWKDKLRNEDIRNYTSTIHTQATPHSPLEGYYLLGDVLPEDKELRLKLQQERLAKLIEKQQEERHDKSFSRKCLFCTKHFSGDRHILFSHMFIEHHFNIGRPDNLVCIKDLLDTLQDKINNLKCIYCERTFKNHAVLKKHMRKKKHFKINAKHRFYDRFYMVNYLEPGKNWEMLEKEVDTNDSSSDDDEENWDDWNEEVNQETKCLFCAELLPSPQDCLSHALSTHGFDFSKLRQEWELDFYSCVKMFNYIRRKVEEKACTHCDERFRALPALLQHMKEEGHFGVKREAEFWQNPQYLFPTTDSDPLLMGFDAVEDSDGEEDGEKRGEEAAAH